MKQLTFVMLLLISSITYSQRLTVTDSLKIGTTTIGAITKDTSLSTSSDKKSVTEVAVKAYVDNRVKSLDASRIAGDDAVLGVANQAMFQAGLRVPKTRKITINGIAKTLEADATYNIPVIDTLPLSLRINNLAPVASTGSYNDLTDKPANIDTLPLSARLTETQDLVYENDTWLGNVQRRVLVNEDTLTAVKGRLSLNIFNTNANTAAIAAQTLQVVTAKGNRTALKIYAQSLVLGDTTDNRISANNFGGVAGGRTFTGGALTADALGAIAHGQADSGQIKAMQAGTIATGYVGHSIGSILATTAGAWAGGQAGYTTQRNIPSTITASGEGSFAHGSTYGGTIKASTYGSFAHGFTNGQKSGLHSTGSGSIVMGYVQGVNTDSIISTANGSFAGGTVSNSTANQVPAFIGSTSGGAFAYGNVTSSSSIWAAGPGSFAQGLGTIKGAILANSSGAFAQGFVQRKGKISATNNGAFAQGFASDSIADGSSSEIKASNWGAFARGYAGFATGGYTGFIYSSGRGSYAGGYAAAGTITASGDASFVNALTATATSSVTASGSASFVNAYVTGTEAATNSGTGSMISGGANANSGNFSFLHGTGLSNATANQFKVGWGADQFVVDGSAGNIKLGVAEVFTTVSEPATPAAGTVVEWFDGTNKKVKKSDGTVIVLY